jgi:hypothetical protein
MATERFGLTENRMFSRLRRTMAICSNISISAHSGPRHRAAANTAEVAIGKGIPTVVEFFGRQIAEERLSAAADLIVAITSSRTCPTSTISLPG